MFYDAECFKLTCWKCKGPLRAASDAELTKERHSRCELADPHPHFRCDECSPLGWAACVMVPINHEGAA